MKFQVLALICFALLWSFEANAEHIRTVSFQEKPFFNADQNKSGPLTLEELDINVGMLNLNEKQQKCMMDSIEEMLGSVVIF